MRTSFGKKAAGLRLERVKASPRWVDGAFRNLHPVLPNLKSSTDQPTLSDFLCGGGRRVPTAPLPSVDPRAGWSKPADTGLRATWLGHSTVLVEIDGVRILTDPVWGERASPVSIAGPKRFQPIPISLADLPPIDAIIVSHDHYDHLDYPTIRKLARSKIPFITSLGVGAHLESWGIAPERITELDWWESTPVGSVTVTATPSQHFSGRTVGGRNSTAWSSFAVKGAKHAFFFSGDTGLTTEYATIVERLGRFDLVMLEVGAFHPSWGDIHLGPENALQALSLLGGGAFLPVHWGTFNLAMHAWDEPAETLLALAPKTNAHLLMPLLGEPIEPSRVESIQPWWRAIAALEKRNDPKEKAAPRLDEAPAQVAGEPLNWPVD